MCVDLSADAAHSIRSARAQLIEGDNSRAHAVKKNETLHSDNVDKRVRSLPPGTTRPQAGRRNL